MLAPIHTSILTAVAHYYTLSRAMLQQLCMSEGVDRDGRRMRKHLTRLLREGLINQTNGEVVFPERNGAPAPVYYPSRKGCEYLAVELKDDRFLSACTLTPNWQHLQHWIAVSRFHIVLDSAVGRQQDVQVDGWLNEWDVANYGEKDPAKRYKLFTEIRKEPRLIFAPDAGWQLSYQGFLKVFYLELDRATSGINQISVSKPPGATALNAQSLHVRHFPTANVKEITVLSVSPTAARRDALQKAIRAKAKDDARLWKFVAWSDIQPESLLHEPILRDSEGKAVPMVKRLEGG